jgi:cytosine/adenosine deaminase-related metal-dependent hydrolase
VLVDGDRIAGVSIGRPAAEAIDLGAVAILPALVNAHAHLELSVLRGRIAAAARLTDWVADVIARREANERHASGLGTAIDELRACGTAAVADVSNTLTSAGPLVASGLWGIVCHELIDFDPEAAGQSVAAAIERVRTAPSSPRVRVTLGPHAPYSVSPAMFAAIRRALDTLPGPTSVHVGESSEELQLLRDGTGPWQHFLHRRGKWKGSWAAPGCGPIEYLDRLGFLDLPRGLLAVHGVHLTDAELVRLRRAGATLVTCPRSNAWTGAGDPPVERFYESGVRVAVGTDSLASVPHLNLFSDLAELRRLAPHVPASLLLDSATRQGARALGLDHDLGTIEPGRSAALIAIEVPPQLEDVEEYLVGGIAAGQIRWVEEVRN